MKRLFAVFSCLILVFMLITLPVFAQEAAKSTFLPKDETIEGDYFGTGDRVQVSGTVNGDAYIAGGTVIVDGIINGDLLSAGGNITISGTIEEDVRIAGGNITISGATINGNITLGGGNITIDNSTVIQGSVVGGGGNLQILGPVGKELTVGAGTILVANTVGGDVKAGAGELSLGPNAAINGDLVYWSDTKANIAEGATVSGSTKHEIPPKKYEGKEVAKGAETFFAGIALYLKGADIMATLLVGILFLLLAPYFMKRSATTIREKFWFSLLTGFLALILIPAAGLILMVTILGIPLALLLFVIYAITLWVAKIFAMLAIGDLILERTKNKAHIILVFILGLIVYEILTIIPVIGWLLQFVAVLAGLGGLLILKKEYYSTLHSKKQI